MCQNYDRFIFKKRANLCKLDNRDSSRIPRYYQMSDEAYFDSNTDIQFKVYTSRWLMLALFCFINASNSLIWVTFAPISNLTEIYIGGSVGNISAVNTLALVFSIFYLPGSILCAYLNNAYNLKFTLTVGGILTVFGTFLRLIAGLCRNDINSNSVYTLFIIGQILSALAQPIFVNVCAYIASLWFAVKQRDIATTIGSMANPVGNAIGQILPAVFVYQDDQGHIQGMSELLGTELAINGVALLLLVLFFQAAPPDAPSASAQYRKQLEADRNIAIQHLNNNTNSNIHNNTHTTDHSSDSHSNSNCLTLSIELNALLINRDYLFLFLAFSLGLAVFNSLVTVLYQLIQPYGTWLL